MLSWEDVRENPGTLALAASWVLVFVLILVVQRIHPQPLPPVPSWEPLKVSGVTGHRFGDWTWREATHGQPWRLLTATSVHFGLVHVTLNTLGLIVLGRLVEPWYRTGPFLAVCLAMGGLGNLIGGGLRQLVGLARPWLASAAASRHWPGTIERFFRGDGVAADLVPSGGGSTILFGLLALGAVVGWRSRTRVGSHLQKQMVLLLGLNAALGLAMPGLVDNFGHLGGAIAGALIGLFDRTLARMANSAWFRALGLAFALGLAGVCLGSAIREDRAETAYSSEYEEVATRTHVARSVLASLNQMHFLYAQSALGPDGTGGGRLVPLDVLAITNLLARGPRTGEPVKPDPDLANRSPAQLAGVLDRLEHNAGVPWGDAITGDLFRLRELARASVASPPTFEQVYEFVVCWQSAAKVIAADLARLDARLAALKASRVEAGR